MRKILLFLVLLLLVYRGYSQTFGFEQQECGVVQNPNYYFENYLFSEHGEGYRLYHNGVVIEQNEASMFGDYAEELRFIDDTTGFFVAWFGDEQFISVEKIINDSVIPIGDVDSWDYNFFIVDKYTVYFVIHFDNPMWGIYRVSDKRQQKSLKNNIIAIARDSTVYDTILGYPLCNNLKELDYQYLNSTDTVTFKIKFSYDDTLANIRQLKKSGIVVYPNPAKDFIRIKNWENGNPYSLSFLDNLGIERKKVENLKGDQEVHVGDLAKGVYFVVVESGGVRTMVKVVRI